MRKFACLVPLVLALAGCTTNKAGSLLVIGGPYRYNQGTGVHGEVLVTLFSDPVLDTATVAVNDHLFYNVSPPHFGNSVSYTFWDTVGVGPATTHELNVTSDVGNASARCMLPGDFAVLTEPAGTLPPSTPLIITWTQSSGASWMMVTANNDGYGSAHRDTVIHVEPGESATLPADWSAAADYLFITVTAGSGPKAVSGSSGNVTGARGFWIGENSVYQRVPIGAGTIGEPSNLHMISKRELDRAYLARIAPYDDCAAEILGLIRSLGGREAMVVQ